jgi:hypothetical protein
VTTEENERPGRVMRPPPPPQGNRRALRHGAFSSGIMMPDVDAFVDVLYDMFPHLRDSDCFAVRDYAISQVTAWRLAAYLEKNSNFDAKGRPRPAVELLRKALERAERARARLGLDPVSRAALHVDQTLVMRRLGEMADQMIQESRLSSAENSDTNLDDNEQEP